MEIFAQRFSAGSGSDDHTRRLLSRSRNPLSTAAALALLVPTNQRHFEVAWPEKIESFRKIVDIYPGNGFSSVSK